MAKQWLHCADSSQQQGNMTALRSYIASHGRSYAPQLFLDYLGEVTSVQRYHVDSLHVGGSLR